MNRVTHQWNEPPDTGSTLLADLREAQQHLRAAAERLRESLRGQTLPDRPRG